MAARVGDRRALALPRPGEQVGGGAVHHRGGIALLPLERGRGHGLDTVQVLCRYAFRVLGLHRVQMETNEPNVAMRAMANRAGFTEEGVLRHAAWFDGRFVDEVVLGLVVDDWAEAAPAS